MNKNLRAGLILAGIIAGVLILAFAAQAAGLSGSNYAGMPYWGAMMGQAANSSAMWSMMGGQYGGMMGSQYGGRNGYMMDVTNMPHHNGSEGSDVNCPFQTQQP